MKKLNQVGLLKVKAETVTELKQNFKAYVLDPLTLETEGYFIGRALLSQILLENDAATGIVISFGMNKSIEDNGQIHLIVESASGIEADDEPNIISNLPKYSTAEIGDPGTDGTLNMIKPKPPM